MKIDISHIVKHNGASLDVTQDIELDTLNAISDDYVFTTPAHFNGTLLNTSGLLKLTGSLKYSYTAKCARCLNTLEKNITLAISEEFVNSEESDDAEYTYTGHILTLDKPLLDNIILHLPVRQVCSETCKGLCNSCGVDLNTTSCDCSHDTIDHRMEVLKNFFNN